MSIGEFDIIERYFLRGAGPAPAARGVLLGIGDDAALLRVPEGYAVGGGLMLGRSQYKFHRIPPRKPLSVQWQ